MKHLTILYNRLAARGFPPLHGVVNVYHEYVPLVLDIARVYTIAAEDGITVDDNSEEE